MFELTEIELIWLVILAIIAVSVIFALFAVFKRRASDGAGFGTRDTALRRVPATSPFDPVVDVFEAHLRSLGIPGGLWLMRHDGAVMCQATIGRFGFSDPRPIASASKWLSATVVMTLVQDRLVDLDHPISLYLPRMAGPKGAITIRQLLSCTAGFPPRVPWLKSPRLSLAENVDQIACIDLMAPPGTQFIYGGVGFQVVGRIAEIVTGKRWHQIFAERLQRQLNLGKTQYGIFAKQSNRFIGGSRLSNPHIGGGVVSTLADYARFLDMILNAGSSSGGEILGSELVTTIETDQTGGAPFTFSPHWNPDARYGLGVWIDGANGARTSQLVSCAGADGWIPWLDRDRGYAGILAAGCDTRSLVPLFRTMTDLSAQIIDTTDAYSFNEHAS